MTIASLKLAPTRHGDRDSPSRPALLHEFFAQAARRWPDRIAVDVPPGADRAERRQVTYAELQHIADGLAERLRAAVTEECVVAVLLPRNSAELYAVQLAALKVGAAYACIDPTFPDAQIGHILADAQPVAIVTDALGLARVQSIDPDARNVFDATASFAGRDGTASAPPRWLTPTSLAYVIYTSGTTGRPKGVMIEHAAIVNLVQSDVDGLGIRPEDRVGQSSSCSYDASVEEIWCAFSAGATLVVMDDDTTRLGPDLVGWLRRERITVLCPCPTLLRTTGCTHPERELPELRCVYIGGEALPADLAERWSHGRCLINGYGPTECAVTAPARGSRRRRRSRLARRCRACGRGCSTTRSRRLPTARMANCASAAPRWHGVTSISRR